jgi:hypothetical protein
VGNQQRGEISILPSVATLEIAQITEFQASALPSQNKAKALFLQAFHIPTVSLPSTRILRLAWIPGTQRLENPSIDQNRGRGF